MKTSNKNQNNNKESIELGDHIYMRKDGRLCARIVVNGVRREKKSSDIRVVKEWLEEQKEYIRKIELLKEFKDMGIVVSTDDSREKETETESVLSPLMTIDELFVHWIKYKEVEEQIKRNTIRNHTERYYKNIQPVLGSKMLKDVDEKNARRVFSKMLEKRKADSDIPYYKSSTIKQAYITLGSMLKYACENNLIEKVPLNRINLSETKKEARFLTKEEQRLFLEEAKETKLYEPCLFILLTGIRIGELIGLRLSDLYLDSEDPSIRIRRTMEYRAKTKKWLCGTPKSISSERTVYLTPQAVQLLEKVLDNRKVTERTPDEFKDLVFLMDNGQPRKNSSYDTYLYKICDKIGIPHFSVHKLRHTYATNAIGNGASPKFVSRQLGHKSINTTLDIYRHFAGEESRKQIERMSKTFADILPE